MKKERKRSIESRTSPKEVWVVREKEDSKWSSFFGLFRKGKLFTDYDKLLKSINNSQIIKIDKYKLESTSEESVGSDMVTNFLKTKEREQNLSIIIEDGDIEEGYGDVINLKNFIKENKKDDGGCGYNSHVIRNIDKYCVSKKSLKDYIAMNSNSFLTFNRSVEYYELLLKVHNFRDYGYYKKKESDGLANFKQAKDNLRKQK